MAGPIPTEVDWDQAPELVEGALSSRLTPEGCDLEYWLRAVSAPTALGHVHGHDPESVVPPHMLEPGPLHDAAVSEFAYRTLTEELATRMISYLVRNAPSRETMNFYATQLLDEARHADIFRWHVHELGYSDAEVPGVLEKWGRDPYTTIMEPMMEFALEETRGGEDFIAGVIMLTVLLEGVLAPAVELSERKWRVFDPPGAEVNRSANIDEVRHLNVGSEIVRRHLAEHPGERARLGALVQRGMHKWGSVPVAGLLVERESLFQRGLERHAAVAGTYEIAPGRPIAATGVEERLALAEERTRYFQDSRMAYMGFA